VKEVALKAAKSPVEWLRTKLGPLLERWTSKFRGRSEDQELWLPTSYEATIGGVHLDETSDAIIARAALPGLDRKDLEVEVTGNRLLIQANKRRSSKTEGRGYLRFEETYASFAQAVSFPYAPDWSRAKAKYKNGILTVRVPKPKHARGRMIPIAA
jgi:HSP20 family molecular chaperone IbpA